MPRVLLPLLLLFALPAFSGKKLVNLDLIIQDGPVRLVGHAHPGQLATVTAQVGADRSDAADHQRYAVLHGAASQADCDADAPGAWGAWYTDLTTADQAATCDLIRGVGPLQARLRIHLEATFVDEVTAPIGSADLSALVAAPDQAAFDSLASGHWPAFWAGLTVEERETYRRLVREVGQ